MDLTEKKAFPAIDLMKFILSFGVVFAHRPVTSVESINLISTTHYLGSVIVPFFFMASTFFYYRRTRRDPDNARAYFWHIEKRLLILYGLWTLLFLPAIYYRFYNGRFDNIGLKMFVLDSLSLFKSFILSESYVHLWYLTACILSIAILYVLRKFFSEKAVLVISAALMVVALILKNADGFFLSELYLRFVPGVVQNSLQKSLFCCALGMALSGMKKEYRYALPTAAVCFVAIFVFGYCNLKWDTVWLPVLYFASCIGFSFNLFIACLQSKLEMKPIYKTLREYSTLIIVSHMLITRELFSILASRTGWMAFETSNFLRFAVTAIFTAVFSTLILKLQKKIPALRYLY